MTVRDQDDGGPQVSPPLTHVLPPNIVGSQQFDPYPQDTQKAKQLLGGQKLTERAIAAVQPADDLGQYRVRRDRAVADFLTGK